MSDTIKVQISDLRAVTVDRVEAVGFKSGYAYIVSGTANLVDEEGATLGTLQPRLQLENTADLKVLNKLFDRLYQAARESKKMTPPKVSDTKRLEAESIAKKKAAGK